MDEAVVEAAEPVVTETTTRTQIAVLERRIVYLEAQLKIKVICTSFTNVSEAVFTNAKCLLFSFSMTMHCIPLSG